MDSLGIQFYPIPAAAPKIIGGAYAAPAEVPYQLILLNTTGRGFLCGATLITAAIALTAAHCVDEGISPDDIKVIGGGNSLIRWEANDQERAVTKIIIHEKHMTRVQSLNQNVTLNDIALLVLSKPFHLNHAISTIPLPRNETTKFKDKACVSGWGRTVVDDSGSRSDTLKTATVPIIPLEDCRRYYAGGVEPRTTGMLCAGGIGGDSHCYGDSGGPLACTGESGSKYLCGIVSTSLKCGTLAYPSTYTKVANYIGWIQSKISDLWGTSSCLPDSQRCAYSTVGDLCPLDMFYCQITQQCIPLALRCNQANDCGPNDYSDEEDCKPKSSPSSKCTTSHFECKISKKCIPLNYMCDKDYDCGWYDISDEADCLYAGATRYNCTADHFQCTLSKKCVPIWYLCDGEHDCGANDTSDEDHCVAGSECHLVQFLCGDRSKCIPAHYRCDGEKHCSDNSDEENCAFHTAVPTNILTTTPTTPTTPKSWSKPTATAAPSSCESSEFQCETTKDCIPGMFVCDGENDCRDGTDEVACGSTTTDPYTYVPTLVVVSTPMPPLVTANVTLANCTGRSFECSISKKCLPIEFKCDQEDDCGSGDRSDEEDCDTYISWATTSTPVVNTTPPICEDGQFQCQQSKLCIQSGWKCDGDFDCGVGDQSDEKNCTAAASSEDYYFVDSRFRL